ncbi:MAG: hydroxyacid dehydrogenase [Treponema sp.]|jgi:phosphoglycerate dehydrogenase-like enzyme|nr:hydroxyacid dehydrogenase [Treponema sp.]
MKACFVCKEGSDRLDYVYKMGRREKFETALEVLPGIVTEKNLDQHRSFLRETEVIITTWNFVPFSDEQISEYFPRLKLVLYGAGSVQGFARPFLNRGIRVVSGWVAMSIPVMEMASSLVLLANKGYFQSLLKYRSEGFNAAKDMASAQFPGSFETKVGILGLGVIGSAVAKRLKQSNLEVLAYDPYLSDERARELGAAKASLEGIFSKCQTVTNHMAHNKETEGMLTYNYFSLMQDYATFVNTARGASVVEADLIRALKEKPARTAVLDVTWPEPVEEGHEFLSLPNVFLSPHIAGYANQEVLRLADYMFDELNRFMAGEKLLYEVTLPMLATMA